MAIELTPEQRQSLQAHPDLPVEVIDPATQRRYVLVAREQFDRLQPAPEPPQLERRSTRPAAPLNIPQRLEDLPTPPELLEEARRYQRKLSLYGKKWLQEIVEEMKLQYYYGGWFIRVLPTPKGRVVVALHRGDDEEYQRQVEALTPEQRQQAVVTTPTIWNDPNSLLGDVISYEG
jgi:hypothetical protein